MNEDFYINLLYKKLAEEISPSEQVQLDAWIATSDENRRTAASVEKAWTLSNNLQPTMEVDLDAEFGKLEALMEREQKNTATVRKLENRPKSGRNWMAIAATLLVLAVAAFLLPNIFNNTDVPTQWTNISAEQTNQELILADGSKVYLNEGASLKFPSAFTDEQRIVELEGTAFFEVEHNASKVFVVKTPSETISVLGTSFSVVANNKGTTTVYVATGKVELAQENTTAKIVLSASEKGISDSNTKQVQHLGQQSVNAIAWHTRRLEFVDTPLSEVLKEVEDLYKIQIQLEGELLKTCPFTDTFDNLKLSTILESISTVFGAEITAKNRTYFLKGGSCE